MSPELDDIWSRVQAQLALVVDESTYRIWLEPLHALELNGDRLLLGAPSHACRWIGERFGRTIQASVELVIGADTRVELVEDSGASRPSSLRGQDDNRGHAPGRHPRAPVGPLHVPGPRRAARQPQAHV